jgi:outer membrane protein TolC
MDEEFKTIDVKQNDMISIAGEPRMQGVVKNHLEFSRLTNFLVNETFRNSPELSQLDLALQSLNRLLKSNERSFYYPEVGLNGTWDQPIHYVGAAEPPPGFTGLTKDPQLTVGAKVSLPILQGGFRKYQVQKNKVSISQLKDQEGDLRNSLEAALRQSMEILSASFQKVALAQMAAEAALENFKIIQDLYRQGEVEIITLIDAQNAALAAKLSANNAVYNFISNFLTVERITGKFYFLMSEAEQNDFVTRMYTAIVGNE